MDPSLDWDDEKVERVTIPPHSARDMQLLFLSFLAGLIAACGFQPIDLWPLGLAGFAALLWLVDEAPNLRSALARGW